MNILIDTRALAITSATGFKPSGDGVRKKDSAPFVAPAFCGAVVDVVGVVATGSECARGCFDEDCS